MKRVYYGTCKSGSGDSEKKVYVPDTDITKGGFKFEEGDLLTVFFAQTNTEDEPSIVIYAQDPEQETSTTSDSGKFIKSLDVEAGMNGAWAAGETVIFAYTQEGSGEAYYWELVDAAHATTLLYGNTKLFDEENLEDLLTTTDEDKYSDLALTPRALKKFWDLLKGSTETKSNSNPTPNPNPTPTPTPNQNSKLEIGLKWTPSDAVSGQETQPLGTLTLAGSENVIEITYPIDSSISKSIDDIASKIVTHTGQLTNNGNGNGEGHETEDSEPFITRMIPNNLYFNNGNGLYYGTPTDDPHSTTGIVLNNGENKLSIKGGNGIVLNSPTQINGNTSVDGTLTTTGAISAGSAQISTTGYIKGGILFENYKGNSTQLNQIYSYKLKVATVTTGDFTVSAGGLADNNLYVNNQSDYKPIGMVGYNITNANSNGKNASYCLPYAMMFYEEENGTYKPRVRWQLRNINSSKDARVKISCKILYVAI